MAGDAQGPTATEQALRQLEEQGIARLQEYLDIFTKFEKPLQLIMRRKYPPEQLAEAEGRKCVLSISGLRYNERTYYFTVSQLTVRMSPPFEGYDTYVQAPLSVVNGLLERVLSGQEGAFGDMVAGGEGKIVGPHAPHDILIWGDVFDELAKNIARLRQHA